jgi:hypothetical protein
MSLFVENNFWVFFLLTVVLGGGAAYMAGRSLALGWKSPVVLCIYMLMFGAGIRFLHFALFQGALSSVLYYITHSAILVAFALLGYRLTRVNQMIQKYPWLYEKSGPLAWRDKT